MGPREASGPQEGGACPPVPAITPQQVAETDKVPALEEQTAVRENDTHAPVTETEPDAEQLQAPAGAGGAGRSGPLWVRREPTAWSLTHPGAGPGPLPSPRRRGAHRLGRAAPFTGGGVEGASAQGWARARAGLFSLLPCSY